MSVQEQVLEDVSLKTKETKNNEIVLYNDDVNSFDHVIDCLVATCGHTRSTSRTMFFNCTLQRKVYG